LEPAVREGCGNNTKSYFIPVVLAEEIFIADRAVLLPKFAGDFFAGYLFYF